MANATEIAHIRAACDQRATAELGYSANRCIAELRIPEAQLRGSIIRHIKAGKRMFHKFTDDGTRTLLPGHIQANVTLSAGPDIYVEAVLMEEAMIIIYAHVHTPGRLLYPQ